MVQKHVKVIKLSDCSYKDSAFLYFSVTWYKTNEGWNGGVKNPFFHIFVIFLRWKSFWKKKKKMMKRNGDGNECDMGWKWLGV